MVKTLDSQSKVSIFKSTDGPKVDSDFHPSEVDQMSTRNFWELVVESKMPPSSGYVAMRQLNPIHEKGLCGRKQTASP